MWWTSDYQRNSTTIETSLLAIDIEEEAFQDIEEGDADSPSTYSDYMRNRISDIDERIFNKTQAYQVLLNSRGNHPTNVGEHCSIRDFSVETA